MFPEQIKVTAQITHLFTVAQRSECRIRPHFFLTGPTGSGKSYLVNQVAEAKNSTIGVRLMNSTVHRYFMKDL